MSERVGTALKVMPFMELDMMAPTAMVAALASSRPNTMPSTPPTAEVVPASMTNWPRMSFCLAPRDFRMPISLVRSVTDTSMMFIMPIPPTSREMAAMATSTIIMVFIMVFMASIISAEVMTM